MFEHIPLAEKEPNLNKEFTQTAWNESIERDLDGLLILAIPEDTGQAGDLTTAALVPEDVMGQATVAVRSAGVIAGLPVGRIALTAVDSRLKWHEEAEDGQTLQPGDPVARIQGPAGSLLQAERLVLNFLGRLSGIATLTREYVDAVAGTGARIYDTRKTTPGWRRLEKYAVRCGGGYNHRTGLFDAILIKDNHLALGSRSTNKDETRFTPAEAVRRARRFIEESCPATASCTIVEIEVDTLRQLEEVLPAGPDIVLLDNMTPEELRRGSRDPRQDGPLSRTGGVGWSESRLGGRNRRQWRGPHQRGRVDPFGRFARPGPGLACLTRLPKRNIGGGRNDSRSFRRSSVWVIVNTGRGRSSSVEVLEFLTGLLAKLYLGVPAPRGGAKAIGAAGKAGS